MMKIFFRSLKIFNINFIILFFFIAILEIIFGYWFKENNFGIYMRAERNKINTISVNHHKNNEVIKFTYRRNFYGFIGNEFNPKNVKIVLDVILNHGYIAVLDITHHDIKEGDRIVAI